MSSPRGAGRLEKAGDADYARHDVRAADDKDHRMRFNRSDIANLGYFLTIARHRNFRLAGAELGVSASALSHAMRGLEERLGVRLLNRTNRSVTLTVAGEELLSAIAQPFGQIENAVDVLNRFRASPAGRIRLNVLDHAATHLLAPIMPVFLDRYPDVEIDLRVTNTMVDVVEDGFDAGIRYGGTVPEDMIAQRLSADLRWVVAGSPAYFQRFGVPAHPDDLQGHRCVQIKLGDDRIYRWEFDQGPKTLELAVPGAITIDDTETAIAMARSGAALIYVAEPAIAEFVGRGELQVVLQDWSSMGPGMHIYYPGRRQLPVPLRLLIDVIRELRPLGL
jgi:DNA-binding transcriptional LysR family regulator